MIRPGRDVIFLTGQISKSTVNLTTPEVLQVIHTGHAIIWSNQLLLSLNGDLLLYWPSGHKTYSALVGMGVGGDIEWILVIIVRLRPWIGRGKKLGKLTSLNNTKSHIVLVIDSPKDTLMYYGPEPKSVVQHGKPS